jgi:hypothetical protein
MGGGMGGGGMGGGGMGGMGGMGGGGMGGMGGGMFRVEPDQPRKMKVATVCLEHGKKDPTPRVKYKLIRLEQFSNDPRVEEVCRQLGYNRVNQNLAQAVAWHFTNGLTWQELANKPRVISQYTGIELFFSPFEIQGGMRWASQIEQQVASQEDATAGTSSSSTSSGK